MVAVFVEIFCSVLNSPFMLEVCTLCVCVCVCVIESTERDFFLSQRF